MRGTGACVVGATCRASIVHGAVSQIQPLTVNVRDAAGVFRVHRVPRVEAERMFKPVQCVF